MNLQYIQSELFRELVNIETLLKSDYELHIHKYGSEIQATLWCKRDWHKMKHFVINAKQILHSKKAERITAELNRIWDSIPAECKKDPLK